MRCVSRHKGARSSATPEAMLRYQQEFRTGAAGMPLVLLECVDFLFEYGNALLNADCKYAVAINPTPVKAIPPRAVIEGWE